MNLKGRDFLTLADFSSAEIEYLLQTATQLKSLQKEGIPHPHLQGKTLGMIFEKPSTRTRVSFEVGIYQLGGHGLFLSPQDLQLGRGETISDTAKVLTRYLDGVMIRTFGHDRVEELAAAADIPVINGLTDQHHPAQVLADLLTIAEHKETLAGLKLCFIGDGNNVAHSLLEGCSLMGMNVSIASPPGFEPSEEIVATAAKRVERHGANIAITNDPQEAIQGADVVYTDVWASMGQEAEQKERLARFAGFQVDEKLCSLAKPDFIFLHCLPAHRGEEVAASIIDGAHSVVFDQAENRLHAQKAILKELLA